jgi:hypothetical protein
MAWERREGRVYYYRSRRVEGRVAKDYFGSRHEAEMAEQADVESRERRLAESQELSKTRAILAPLDQQMAALDRACDTLKRATLVAAGFYEHNYAWRRRRGRSTRDHDDSGDQ